MNHFLPAFPRPIGHNGESGRDAHEESCEQVGMSLRQYFAAHAPSAPQPWFEPIMPPKPVAPADKPTLPEDFSEEERYHIDQLAWSWRKDPCYDLTAPSSLWRPDQQQRALVDRAMPALVAYATAWKAYWNAQVAWELQHNLERCVQWPWAYANAVLDRQEVSRG